MVAASYVVKQTARAALKNNWFKGIAAAAVLCFSFFIMYIGVSLLGIALSDIALTFIWIALILFVFCPLLLGALRFFWRIMWESDDSIITLFHYFSSREQYSRAVKLIFALLIKILWIGFLLMIPAILTDIASSVRLYEFLGFSAPAWTSNLWVASVFLKSAAVAVLVVIMLKYYLAPFLVVADEEMDVLEAVHKSTVLSRATAMDFILLVLSFLGWILLSVTVIPLIFTIPYFIVSYLVHSRFSVANYNNVVKEFNVSQSSFSAESMEI